LNPLNPPSGSSSGQRQSTNGLPARVSVGGDVTAVSFEVREEVPSLSDRTLRTSAARTHDAGCFPQSYLSQQPSLTFFSVMCLSFHKKQAHAARNSFFLGFVQLQNQIFSVENVDRCQFLVPKAALSIRQTVSK